MTVLRELVEGVESRGWRLFLIVVVVGVSLGVLLGVLSFKLLKRFQVPINRRNLELYLPSVRRRG